MKALPIFVLSVSFLLTGCDYSSIPEETRKQIQEEANLSDEAVDGILNILEKEQVRVNAEENTAKFLKQAEEATSLLRKKLEAEKALEANKLAEPLEKAEESKEASKETK